MANWSDLHHDLLVLIAKRINSIEDFVAFGCVCHSWRLAATKQNFTKLAQIPWLMLASDDVYNSPLREFYSLSEDRVHKMMLPESKGNRCFSSQGWLLTVGKDEEVNLLHPLSRCQIRLPNLRTFSDLETQEVGVMYTTFIEKVVLSASPTIKSDYVVMVILGASPKLAFYRAGDDAWTTIETYFAMYLDVIYYNERFYAVDCRGRVLVWDVNGPNPTMAEVVSVLPVGHIRLIEKLYLVESSGKLLMVSREGVGIRYLEEGSNEMTYGTKCFQVFEMNVSNGSWEKVKRIGNVALFLGDNSSFSMNVHFTTCKANCIYYTDDCSESYQNNEVAGGGGKDMGVYNLLDGSFETHFKGESYSVVAPPLWVEVEPTL